MTYDVFYTDAPEVYDWAHTKTVHIVGERKGRPVRLVSVGSGLGQHQAERYASGGFMSCDSDLFEYFVSHGEITLND